MIIHHANRFLPLTLGLTLLLTGVTLATPEAPPDTQLLPEPAADGQYEYVLEGRFDPFVPFIKKQTIDPNAIVEVDEELTGLRAIEPGQLTLVATMESDNRGYLGMVEDVTGKGYILSQGTLVGARGEVTAISDQEVIITEKLMRRSGEELTNTVVMRLKNEGDE